MESTAESEIAWQQESERAGKATVMAVEGLKAGAWFLGENVPGKRRSFQVYMGGGGVYQDYCNEAAAQGYPGFTGGELQPASNDLVPA